MFIPYARQDITAKDIKEVIETLKSDFITQGPKVEKFEKVQEKIICSGNNNVPR